MYILENTDNLSIILYHISNKICYFLHLGGLFPYFNIISSICVKVHFRKLRWRMEGDLIKVYFILELIKHYYFLN